MGGNKVKRKHNKQYNKERKLKRKRRYSSSETESTSSFSSDNEYVRKRRKKKKISASTDSQEIERDNRQRKSKNKMKEKLTRHKKEKKKKKSKQHKTDTEDKIKGNDSSKEKLIVKDDGGKTEHKSTDKPSNSQIEQTSPAKRVMVPMTKEEYEKQQSVIRRVFDPETGRHRLVKGDGEIMEECVSFARHKEINKHATQGDGASFQKILGMN